MGSDCLQNMVLLSLRCSKKVLIEFLEKFCGVKSVASRSFWFRLGGVPSSLVLDMICRVINQVFWFCL